MVRLGVGLRIVSALAIVAGLLLSMDGASPQARPRASKAGYIVLAADFHVHSFPGDGLLPPWDLAVEARRRHLDAIALTNHNSTHSWRLAQWLSPIAGRAGGAMLIPGVELTAVGYHLALVGVTSPIDWRLSAGAAAAAVHATGGVAIAAHPGKDSWPFLDDAALAALDGVEAVHPMMHVREKSRQDLAAFYERAQRVHPGIAAIGSTDFHHFAPLGLGRTYLLARTATQAGILDAIRAGRTVACDGNGDAYGPAELVAMVRDDCRQDAASPPDGETALARLGTWLVWFGVVGLVVFGAD
ncbi:MAG TPA: CehA/McbA family metallohydrolase [Vicinamibacterales bacterium]